MMMGCSLIDWLLSFLHARSFVAPPFFRMADIATPSAATMSTIDAGAEHPEKAQKQRPEKPDEDTYKKNLQKAEKEHADAQAKIVRMLV